MMRYNFLKRQNNIRYSSNPIHCQFYRWRNTGESISASTVPYALQQQLIFHPSSPSIVDSKRSYSTRPSSAPLGLRVGLAPSSISTQSCWKEDSSNIKILSSTSSYNLRLRLSSTKTCTIDEAREWSQSNPELARTMIQSPPPPPAYLYHHYHPFQKHQENSNDSEEVFEAYLHWRKYYDDGSVESTDVMDTTSNDNNTTTTLDTTCPGQQNKEDEDQRIPLVLLSHTLTFPLTLAWNAHSYLQGMKFCNHEIGHAADDCSNKNDSSTSSSNNASLTNLMSSNTSNQNHLPSPFSSTRTIRLCCVGARSEATLPLEYWKEFLILCNLQEQHKQHLDQSMTTSIDSSNDDYDDNSRDTINYEWIIDFIGPDVVVNQASRHVTLPIETMIENNSVMTSEEEHDNLCENSQDNEHSSVRPPLERRFHSKLTMNYIQSHLHSYIIQEFTKYRTQRNVDKQGDVDKQDDDNERLGTSADSSRSSPSLPPILQWDGFVLFNPGIGHPNLQESWKPTLKYMVQSSKPILFTAHSNVDGKRDVSVLIDLLTDINRSNNDDGEGSEEDSMSIHYKSNPFASRMKYEDPFFVGDKSNDTNNVDDGRLVRPNQFFLFYTKDLSRR